MHGLAGALDKLHNQSQINCRHGGLKPENIVRTTQQDSLGRLLIADMGLAKIHSLPTRKRMHPSLSGGGTLRYSPPETKIGWSNKTSRSYDMWSIGRVLIGFTIWLLYGKDELDRFDAGCFKTDSDAYYDVITGSSDLQPNVRSWLQHIEATCLLRYGPCVSPALRRLFYFVVDRLLIEDLESEEMSQDAPHTGLNEDNSVGIAISLTTVPTAHAIPSKQGRAKSEQLLAELKDIVHQLDVRSSDYIHDPDFVMSGANCKGPLVMPKQIRLVPVTACMDIRINEAISNPRVAKEPNTQEQYTVPAGLDVWNTHTDNQFANGVYQHLRRSEITEVTPKRNSTSSLCARCISKSKGLLSPSLFTVSLQETEQNRTTCSLCALLYAKLQSLGVAGQTTSIVREGLILTTRIGEPPVFSIVVGPQLGE